VHAGKVQVGDEVQVAPDGPRARVRSIHAQDCAARQGSAGQRCALNLAGLAREAVERGQWVQAAGLANAADRFDASIRLVAQRGLRLGQWANVLLHHGTEQVAARVALLDAEELPGGGQALATISVQAALALCRGDRFVLRDSSARRTLGGGVVLAPQVVRVERQVQIGDGDVEVPEVLLGHRLVRAGIDHDLTHGQGLPDHGQGLLLDDHVVLLVDLVAELLLRNFVEPREYALQRPGREALP